MSAHGHHRHAGALIGLIAMLSALILAPMENATVALAQEAPAEPAPAPSAPAEAVTAPLLLLRPHCDAPGSPPPSLPAFLAEGTPGCPNFAVADPYTMETQALEGGDELDLDVAIFNPGGVPIRRVRAWLSYDATALEGQDVTVDQAFSQVLPGEADIAPELGYVQIGASAAEGQEPSGTLVGIARVRFRVKTIPSGGVPISFFDFQERSTEGHTYAAAPSDPQTNILPAPGVLLVRGSQEPVTTPSPATIPDEAPPPTSHPAADEQATQTDFTLLQVQNVRVTTEGTAIYLAWDPLRASEVVGYNVYYGTEKGRYMQRHAVDVGTHSLALRGFVSGSLYYLAVRAVNGGNEESAFSQEVAVTVGDPHSSTSPLPLSNIDRRQAPRNPIAAALTGSSVPGASGNQTWTIVLLALAAASGVAMALRRSP